MLSAVGVSLVVLEPVRARAFVGTLARPRVSVFTPVVVCFALFVDGKLLVCATVAVCTGVV